MSFRDEDEDDIDDLDEDEDDEALSASGFDQGSLPPELEGLEISDLGDLTDVPHAYLREVVDLIRSLPSPEDEPGGLDHMRNWIRTLPTKGGFSREATLHLLRAIAQVIEATRPKGVLEVTRESLQQAFVRVGGVREIVNVMLMRLNDAAVVAACIRVITASVSGAPLAAEALHNDGADKLRLMLRAIERHYTSSFDVAEQGCLLICHLCAPTAKPGASAAPVRGRAHRDSQRHLADAGTIDLMVEILAGSIMQVKDMATHIEQQKQKAAEADAKGMVARREGNKSAADSVQRVKANIELRQAWVKLNTMEATAGRVQDAALQALILLSFGNEEMMRMLAGVLWCWETSRLTAMQASVVASMKGKGKGKKDRLAKGAGKGVMGPGDPGAAKNLRGIVGGQMMGKGRKKGAFAAPPPEEPEDPLPKGEERCALTTFEGFTRCCSLLLEVLKGRASRDRPQLAAKACRLLKALTEYNHGLMAQIEVNRKREKVELEVTLLGAPVPEDNRKPEAPFAPLAPVVEALMFAIRMHKQEAPFLVDGIATLKRIKDLALIAAPAGVAANGDTLTHAWQRMITDAEEKEELRFVEKCLRDAVETTDLGNARREQLGIGADDLTGSGTWLTPRMRDAAAAASTYAAELSGDALASKWKNGDPERRNRRTQALKQAEEAKEEKSGRGGSKRGARHKDASARSASSSKTSNTASPSMRKSAGKVLNAQALGRASSKANSRGSSTVASSRRGTKNTGKPEASSEAEEGSEEEKYVRENPRSSTEVPRLLGAALQTLLEVPKERERGRGDRKLGEEPAEATGQSRGRSAEVGRAEAKRGAVALSVKDLKKGLKQGMLGDGARGDTPEEWHRALGYGEHDPADFDRVWRRPLQEVLDRSLSMPVVGNSSLRPETASSTGSRSALPSDPLAYSNLDIDLIKSEPGVLKTRVFVPSQDKFHQSTNDIRLNQLLSPKFSEQMVTQNLCKTLRKSGCLLPEYGIQIVFKRGKRDLEPPPRMLQTTGAASVSQTPSGAGSRQVSRAASQQPSRLTTPSSKKRAASRAS